MLIKLFFETIVQKSTVFSFQGIMKPLFKNRPFLVFRESKVNDEDNFRDNFLLRLKPNLLYIVENIILC